MVNSQQPSKPTSGDFEPRVHFHPNPTPFFPYPFLTPSEIQTSDLLFVNVSFYSLSAPGWKAGAKVMHSLDLAPTPGSAVWVSPPREKPHTGAAAREQPRASPVIAT